MVGSKSPKVSILMPTHNRADVISFAIESVLNQTEKDFELLIVGDGCTDTTSQVVSGYLKDERVKWFDFPKAAGFGYANRNKVLRKAEGEYIAFVAHDDIIFPDHLEILASLLDEDNTLDIVYSRPLWVDSSGMVLPSSYNLENQRILDFFLNIGNGIPASCVVHRRECFKKVGYWDEELPSAADWDMWKRIIKHGKNKNFAFESRPTVFHFKAIWKKETQTWPIGLHYAAQYIKESPEDLPRSMKIKIVKNQAEQQAFAKKVQTDKDWREDLRKDTIALIDGLVQNNLIHFWNEYQQNNKTVGLLKSDIARKDIEINRLRNSIFFKVRSRLLQIFPDNSFFYRMLKRLRNN